MKKTSNNRRPAAAAVPGRRPRRHGGSSLAYDNQVQLCKERGWDMRIVIAGAQITDAVADTLDMLQNEPEMVKSYIDTIDELTRKTILDLDAADDGDDAATMGRLRVLQMLRRDILALSSPPDADLPENDTPVLEA